MMSIAFIDLIWFYFKINLFNFAIVTDANNIEIKNSLDKHLRNSNRKKNRNKEINIERKRDRKGNRYRNLVNKFTWET